MKSVIGGLILTFFIELIAFFGVTFQHRHDIKSNYAIVTRCDDYGHVYEDIIPIEHEPVKIGKDCEDLIQKNLEFQRKLQEKELLLHKKYCATHTEMSYNDYHECQNLKI